MVVRGTRNYLSGFKGPSADAGAVSGAKNCRGKEDLFSLPEVSWRVARHT